MREIQNFEAWTDGSCNNLSPYGEGGAAYVILKNGKIFKQMAKGFVNTTNNKMELLAIISAINSLPDNSTVTIHTDSQYCIRVLTRPNKIRKNIKLIQLYHHTAAKMKQINFEWVKGHSGNKYNEMVDEMASKCTEQMRIKYNIPLYTIKNSPKIKKYKTFFD